MRTGPPWQKLRVVSPNPISATMNFNKLQAFRRAAYQYLCRAHDATFELTDAILLTPESLLFSRSVFMSSISPPVAEYLRSA